MRGTNTAYRPDIDGLRAVAVLLVVLNHLGFSTFSGGFIGVDVFFVISGYLITGIILNQVAQGTFSLVEFYTRRAWRILPALYIVLISVMIAGYVIYIPSDYSMLSESTMSAILFASNIFFWKNSGGYFSSSAEEMPLLHIWSLSVEEQFYFVWPVVMLLILMLRTLSARLAIIAAILAASFALAEYGVLHQWGSAYFLLPYRAGELLIGSALAFWASKRLTAGSSSMFGNIVSILGLALILLPSFLLNKSSGFPGVNALIPCIGAALIIAAPMFGTSVVTKVLSSTPFVSIGLISYSLYLWHWPLISFLRYARIEITYPLAAGILATALILSYLTWRFIENTFRYRKGAMGVGLATAAAAGFIVAVAGPAVVYLKDGLPSRFPYAILTQDQLNAERQRYWQGIGTRNTEFSNQHSTKNVVVVGNSHAYDFSYALTENDFSGNIKLIETSHHCFNFGHDAVLDQTELCQNRQTAVLQSAELKTADVIYLHDEWSRKNLEGLHDMLESIRLASAAPIVVIGPKMIFKDSTLNISKLAQQARHVTTKSINEYASQYQRSERVTYDKELKQFFSTLNIPNVQYISALDIQCGEEMKCDILSKSGEYLYFDGGHFTLAGSKAFGHKLKESHQEIF